MYGLLIIRTGILDYLREGLPWHARPFKHMESNSFKQLHLQSFQYTNWYFILLPGPRGLARPALHIFKCRYHISIHLQLKLHFQVGSYLDASWIVMNWLVVYLPLWKMMEFASWDDDIPNMMMGKS